MPGKFSALVIILVTLFSLPLRQAVADTSQKNSLEKVTLQFKWTHQFQFAGYYAAKEKGFFADEGLDVVLKERVASEDYLGAVIKGEADYGTADCSLLLQRLKGKSFVLLTQIFQHSPLVFLSRKDSGIISPYEMIGKKVMFDGADAPLNALLLDTLGNLSRIKHFPLLSTNMDDLVERKVDVMSAYLTGQPFTLKQQGVEINIINPQNYGIDFYGDNLFTTEKEVLEHPERVEKMIRATIKGWEYALGHKEEIIDLILAKYNPHLKRGQLAFEARMTDLMILPDLIQLGDINPKRYEKIIETYNRLGITGQTEFPSSFIYQKQMTAKAILTDDERAWLKKHPRIVLGAANLPPVVFANTVGSLAGAMVDFNALLNKRLGTDIKLEIQGSALQAEEMAKNFELDGLFPSVSHIKDREPFFTFSDKVATSDVYIFTRMDSADVGSLADLKGKKVGYIQGMAALKEVLERSPALAPVGLPNTPALLDALLEGRVDAVLGLVDIQHAVTEGAIKIKLAHVLQEERLEVVYSIRKDWPELVSIINKGLATITPQERAIILEKWLIQQTSPEEGLGLTLSAEEKNWLMEHPVITLAIDNTYPPLNYLDEQGHLTGLSVDYVNLIARKAGISINYAGSIWSVAIKKALDHEVDGAVNADVTEERKRQLNFTESYAIYPSGLVTIKSQGNTESFKDLAGKIICVKNNSSHLELIKNSSEAQIHKIETLEEGFELVLKGEAFGLFDDVSVLGYLISHYNFANLKINFIHYDTIVGIARLGLRNDDPVMLDVFNKAIVSITPRERQDIQSRWLSVIKERTVLERHFDWMVFFNIVIPLVLLFLTVYFIALLHNLRLKRVVANKTKDLLESREQFRILIEHAADAVFVHDLQGKLLMVNQMACSSLGYTSTELLDMSVDQVDDETAEKAANEKKWSDLEPGKPIGFESLHKRKDGSVFPVEVRIGLIEHSGQKSVLAIARDITERRQSEQESILLSSVIDQAGESVMITDKDAVLQYVNPAFENISGYSRYEVIGEKPYMLKSGKHDDAYYNAIWEKVLSGQAWFGLLINQRKDGGFYEEDATIFPIKNQIGDIVNIVAINRDVTHEKVLEQRLQQAQKMESIGTLAGGIAHDFNNILSAVFGYTQLAQMAVGNPEKQEKALDGINQAAKRAKNLVKQILTFSRKGGQERRPLTLATLSKEVLQLIRQTIPATISISSDISSTQTIWADPTQIHQVLMNLCTNAFHAMRTTGGTLMVSVLDRTLRSQEVQGDVVVPPGNYVLIEVSDTGVGMDVDTLQKIFEPYYTTKDVGEGTGLGLSVVHGIIASHHGYILVESQRGSGTTFHIYIPAFENRPEEETGGERAAPNSLQSSGRVLFVDDDEDLVDIARKAFPNYSYSVSAFRDPGEALKEFLQAPDKYDLVITDMTMPTMTGIELTRAILAIRPGLPVYLCTGYSELITREDAEKQGVKTFIEKPYTTIELIEIINKNFQTNQ